LGIQGSGITKAPFSAQHISRAVGIARGRNCRMQPSAVCSYIRNAVGSGSYIDTASAHKLLFKDMQSKEARTVFNIGLACLEAGGSLPVEATGFDLAVHVARESNKFVDGAGAMRASWEIDEAFVTEVSEKIGFFIKDEMIGYLLAARSQVLTEPAADEPAREIDGINYFPGCPLKTREFRGFGDLRLVREEPNRGIGEVKRFSVYMNGSNAGTFFVQKNGPMITRSYVYFGFRTPRLKHLSWTNHAVNYLDIYRILSEWTAIAMRAIRAYKNTHNDK